MNQQSPDKSPPQEAELLPCPFCGFQATLEELLCNAEGEVNYEDGCRTGATGMCCPDCACYIVGGDTNQQAIENWNKRSSPDFAKLKADIAELRTGLDILYHEALAVKENITPSVLTEVAEVLARHPPEQG